MRYLQTSLGQRAHLGRPIYDDDTDAWIAPDTTLCALTTDTWSKQFVRPRAWSQRTPGTVCDTCDRTAMWEAIIELNDW